MGRFAVRFLAPVLVFLTGTAGCGGTTLYPVKGKILVNGQPAVGAQVMFFPEGKPDLQYVPPTGTAEADGSFTVATGAKPGAPAGKYVVTVVWPDPNKKLTAAERMQGLGDVPDLLRGQYATPEKSKLRAEVRTGETTLETFDLK